MHFNYQAKSFLPSKDPGSYFIPSLVTWNILSPPTGIAISALVKCEMVTVVYCMFCHDTGLQLLMMMQLNQKCIRSTII